MSVHKLFNLENEIGTQTTYTKGATGVADSSIGICKALSALWCKNVLEGKSMLNTKPSTMRAALIQAKGEMTAGPKGADLTNVLGPLDMKVTSILSMPGKQAIHYIGTKANLYMLRYPGHAMAAKTGKDGWFFLDPEEGLFLCSSLKSFESQIWKLYGKRKNEAWTCQAVANA